MGTRTVGVVADRPTANNKKSVMRTVSKLAHMGHPAGRSPLSGILDHVRRALSAAAPDRRPTRPLQDLDDWSDQVEVAYYEACRVGYCP